MWQQESGVLEMFLAYYNQFEENLVGNKAYRDFLMEIICSHETSLKWVSAGQRFFWLPSPISPICFFNSTSLGSPLRLDSPEVKEEYDASQTEGSRGTSDPVMTACDPDPRIKNEAMEFSEIEASASKINSATEGT